MTGSRIFAILFIYLCTAVAWLALGGTVVQRTGEFDQRLAGEVAELWGGQHQQLAPEAAVVGTSTVSEDVQEREGDKLVTRKVTKTVATETVVPLDSSRIDVDLALDQRRKGLLWYATYAVAFKGEYRLKNPDAKPRTLVIRFAFPSTQAIYDGFEFEVNGEETPPVTDLSRGMAAFLTVPPHGEVIARAAYRSRGLGEWTYAFARGGVAQVRDFQLALRTDFTGIDFPGGTLSPTTRALEGKGYRLDWRFASLVTGQKIGLQPPNRLNPGPLAARITFFAPVSLLFFLTVMVILGALGGRSLHPMHYFFLSAAFFAFHLLLAYLVDHLDIHLAFAIAAAISVLLVVSYLRLVAGLRIALLRAGLAQLVFLVLFSYAFFFEGYTGLTVTIGATLTLFVLMQVTARLDWEQVFARASVRKL